MIRLHRALGISTAALALTAPLTVTAVAAQPVAPQARTVQAGPGYHCQSADSGDEVHGTDCTAVGGAPENGVITDGTISNDSGTFRCTVVAAHLPNVVGLNCHEDEPGPQPGI
ncbi:hypothetical protein ACFV6E_07320 [Streptomyces sp. NPDC059785]|uniref:hypothetical protein n=1 Tax=unclassified Streptomyces TaxID=2593676 RepID=UPI00364D62FB